MKIRFLKKVFSESEQGGKYERRYIELSSILIDGKNMFGLKLNYYKYVFFPHPFICMRSFITEKVGNQRN